MCKNDQWCVTLQIWGALLQPECQDQQFSDLSSIFPKKINSFLKCFMWSIQKCRHPKVICGLRTCSVLRKEGSYSLSGVEQGDMNPWPLWRAVYLKCVCKQKKQIASMLSPTTRACFLSRLTLTCSSCHQTVPFWFQWTAITKPATPFLPLMRSQKNRWQKRTRWGSNLILCPPEMRRQCRGCRRTGK